MTSSRAPFWMSPLRRCLTMAIEYLIAMASCEGNVSTKQIADRLNLPATSLTSTRREFIKAQVIDAPSRGVVRFSIPLLREYLLKSSNVILSRY